MSVRPNEKQKSSTKYKFHMKIILNWDVKLTVEYFFRFLMFKLDFGLTFTMLGNKLTLA